MIAIVNVTEGGLKKGLNDYEVRINQKVICTFQHDREDGLARCLEQASYAVIYKRLEEISSAEDQENERDTNN